MHTVQPFRQPRHRRTQIAALLASSAFAALFSGVVHAQQTAPESTTAEDKKDTTNMNRVVVTATSAPKSKMRSSVSVTDVDADRIKDFGARTEAEVLLLIPGIRTDSTAGSGGNANISVRGLPIASGGSKFVQLQEDGLPTVQFGDMNFGNNDYWTRFDNSVDTIQTLRGGSASVFASHAPGAVINYLSKTGKQKGGSVGITRGLNYNETRLDGDFGMKLAPDLYFHIGGYFREGEGLRHTDVTAVNGYQLKGNITKEFNGGKGYVRAYVKLLDEHAPANAQTFLQARLSGNTYTGFSKAPGYDGTRDSEMSPYNASVLSVNPATGGVVTSSLNRGITVKSQSVGLEFRNEFAGGFTVDNKFRYADNSSAFQAQFWDLQTLGNLLGTSGQTARYFNGPKAGQVVTAANLSAGLVSKGAAINTQSPDMGNLFNDLSISRQLKLGIGTLDVKGGWFHSRQNVQQRWSISERVMEAGRDGALIDLFDGAGAALTSAGLTGYNNQWGCCARDLDVKYTTDAPYLSLNLASGNFDFDGGVRHETFRAKGSYAGPKLVPGGLDVNGDGVIDGAEKNVYVADTANASKLDYKINYTSYSLGLNYRVSSDLSVFVRQSKGYRAIADRLLYSPFIDTAGALTAYGKTIAAAPVKQSEVGLKFRGRTDAVNYNVAATVFRATTEEYDYDQTRQDDPSKPGFQGPKLDVKGYKATGLELETGATVGNLGLNVNLTYSDEKLASSLFNPASVGKVQGGVPKWRYTISPRYAIGDAVIGATIRGNSWVYADDNNVRKVDGHYIVSAFVNYDFGRNITGSLNVNNLFDKVYPAAGTGFVGGSTSIVGGAETGRTISATVKYAF
ncbi:TonB-dependent receptor [Pseudaquabacterium pictum]|uniref:TonB-dependent receptor n=1 Tax=Pseudaquabacterium pictum TaxID=2315236 RepID=A0A480AY80_9BURK|nr:TonB-dependent receptor [Rubrivivax pictus]GCL66313.1 TonB-dependent receptor [Rubrivivax pictus]